MSSWRATASAQAQADLDALLDAALPFAQEQLGKHGEFFPYAAAVGRDGQLRFIAPEMGSEHPRPTDVIGGCLDALSNMRDQIRASAIVTNVHIRDLGTDAIEVSLEHTDGHAITVHLAYAKKSFGRGIDYGALTAQGGQRRVWGEGR